jgi:hypothetical protein
MPISFPYKFSDWYGYDKDCAALTQFSGSSGQMDVKFVCNQTMATDYWHNGSGTYPAVGDTVYTDSAGVSTTGSRYIRMGFGYHTFSSLNGVVTNISLCAPPPP